MGEVSKDLWETLMKQTTDNVPKLYIQDINSGRVFEYGKNCHDRLIISEDGRCIYYSNMQNSDGSKVGDYRFYYEKPKFETEAELRNAYDIDEWARTVEHQSISKLLAEERKRVVQEIRELYEKPRYNPTAIFGVIRRCDLTEILDKIERGDL